MHPASSTRPMKASTKRVDVEYMVQTARPALGMFTNIVGVLEEIYHSIRPHIDITSRDLRVQNSDVVRDVKISVVATGANGIFEATVDGYTAWLSDSSPSRDGAELVKRCCGSFDVAMSGLFSREAIDHRRLRIWSWLSADDGREAVHELLQDIAGREDRIDRFGIGATRVFSPQYLRRFANEDEQWAATIQLQESELPTADLFFLLDVHCTPGGSYETFERLVTHTETIYRTVLTSIGICAEE